MVRGSDDLHATEHCPDIIDKGFVDSNLYFMFFWIFFSPALCGIVAKGREREECLPNNFAVDGAGYAVLQLEIHLGNGVFGENGSIRDIT